jgi:hypothetical protein
VADYIQTHHSQLIARSAPGPKPRRRWETAAVGELWQHDSSPTSLVASHRAPNPHFNGR